MRSILVVASLCSSLACAGMSSSTAPTAAATATGSCSPAMAERGTIVYARPDTTSDLVARLADRTQLCAESESVGYGFHRVKLDNGRVGYVADDELTL